jgi:hypothetical protein
MEPKRFLVRKALFQPGVVAGRLSYDVFFAAVKYDDLKTEATRPGYDTANIWECPAFEWTNPEDTDIVITMRPDKTLAVRGIVPKEGKRIW